MALIACVLRSAASPSTGPYGIGGDANTIWHCDYGTDLIYELSITDFSVVRSAASPSVAPSGIGGDANTIWHCDGYAGLIYELSTTDFSVVKSAASPSVAPNGIGGDANAIWHCDGTDLIYELSITDFSVVKSAASPSTGPYGIGGDANAIWHCDYGTDLIYELSITDFSVVRSAASPSTWPYGIGGDANKIWHCDGASQHIYELKFAEAVTYYFNGRSASAWTDPNNFDDGNIATFASVSSDSDVHEFDSNTCPGTDLGTIIKVELRVHGKGDGNDQLELTPVFAAGDGDVHETVPVVDPGGWTAYVDITTDTNAPSPWTWAAVQALDCDAARDAVSKANTMYGSKVEIRVAYEVAVVAIPRHGFVNFQDPGIM